MPQPQVPVIPASQRLAVLQQHHDISSAGHLGLKCCKILKGIVESTLCQHTKPPAPTTAPLSIPIVTPWEMVAVDIECSLFTASP